MAYTTQLFPEGKWLTDGGLETTLIFHHGIELPHFAAFELLTQSEGREVLDRYYTPYLELADRYGLRFILETPTWRANTDWGFRMGYTQNDLDGINRKAVRFVRGLKEERAGGGTVLLSGSIGPRGDGYAVENAMSPDKALSYHRPQIRAFAEEGADLATAMTLNYSDEAIGLLRAAAEVGIPAVISFTVETDGRLPNGESLPEAIERTDRMTDRYATHFMINCAHPEHFTHVLEEDGEWKERIRGIRANASTKSHAELDESDTLDTGDRSLLADGYLRLRELLPDLRIIGGCCGTDHTHLEQVCGGMFGGE